MKKAVLGVCLFLIFYAANSQTANAEENLAALKLELPQAEAPIANYVKWTISGNLLFTSGHGPGKADTGAIIGRLGSSMNVSQGYSAARSTALQLLATIKSALGSLDRVDKILKVTAWVNSSIDFTEQPKVVNGFSDLMVAVFGDKGRHARTAVGTNTLPNGIPVEIEMVIQFK